MNITRRILGALSLAGLAMAAVPRGADAQFVRTNEQFYWPAKHNWVFRTYYPGADRLFNAFDYGHAILYETLFAEPNAPASKLEVEIYDRLTRKILTNPPRVPLEEMAIEPTYARLAPEAKAMFEWAHILHRQLYDVLADERLSPAQKDAEVATLMRYYRTRPDLAFSAQPKSMALMQEQPYSLAFRQKYPKFNGLIWAYHWLQVGLYEPLLVGTTSEARQAGVTAAVARFRQMMQDPERGYPHVMPMTGAIAPEFAKRYPEAAIVFDNLHSMHDVISDILANPSVPRREKRARILEAASRYRDDVTEVMTVAGWQRMSIAMGVENQGGPALGFVAALPTPTVARGAVMRHDNRTGEMIGGDHGGHAGHGAPGATPAAPPADTSHSAHGGHAGHDVALPLPSRARDSAAVLETVQRFHAALTAGDSLAALALLAGDVTILESGAVETRAEYRAHHLGADIAFARAVPSTRGPYDVTVLGDVAWVSGTSLAEGTFQGRAVKSAGAELLVLSRTPDGWRIRAIHWSSRRRS